MKTQVRAQLENMNNPPKSANGPADTPKRIRPDWHADIWHVGIILACGAAFRLIYQMAYKPWWSGDSVNYSDVFYLWTRHIFVDAERTPGYPLFLGLAQWLAGNAPMARGMGVPSQYLAVRLQFVLGLLAAVFIYFSLRALSVRPKLALAGGIGFALIGAVCLFEMRILSELLSLFFLMLGMLFFLRCMQAVRNGTGFTTIALVSGASFSFAMITRPENLVLVVVLSFILLLLAVRCSYLPAMQAYARPLVELALLLVIAAAPLVLSWMTMNLVNIGQFRINTYNGALRTETTYNMFNLVDAEDRVVGDRLWRSYLLSNSNGQVKRDHVWDALDDITHAWQSGLLPIAAFDWTRPENAHYPGQVVHLYDYLGQISWRLAKKHPLLYLRNVLNNFASDTFDHNLAPPSPAETQDPHAPEGGSVVRDQTFYTATVWINRIETPLLTAAYVVLLAYVMFSPLLLLSRERDELLRDGAVVAIAMGAFASVFCMCAVAAYFPEHGVPFMGVLVICVVYTVSNSKRIVRFWKTPTAKQ
jgi:hypothetical protein